MSILIVFSGVELAAGQNPPIHENLQSQLIGAWRLVWSEDQGADGKIHRIERTGILTFSHDGHMSVQIRVRDPGELPAATAKKYWQGGYAAYYGRYDVDEHAHTITFHVEGALVRTLIGTDLIRVYDFSGNQLVLKPLRPDEHWAFAWEHY